MFSGIIEEFATVVAIDKYQENIDFHLKCSFVDELKIDQSADIALKQIEEKGYAKPFANDPRKLFKIGLNFSIEKRCIDDWRVE